MDYRIAKHPVLEVPGYSTARFTFDGMPLQGISGQMISSALFANGIRIFGTHHKDGSGQGIFCANGQCSQCMVLVEGLPVKSCMTPLKEGMNIVSCKGLPELPPYKGKLDFSSLQTINCQALVIGAGPSGLSAAIELGKGGIDTILLDDKSKVGGKLLLQTHKFFGSVDDCYAGTRGIDIADILFSQIKKLPSVRVFLNTTACAVFSDKKVGVASPAEYKLISFEKLLIAAGAREKSIVFPGCTLPGVYGAGAFQTLVNRDLVKAAKSIFIIGGGNVGLISAYHAIQAGIEVKGLAEACPSCSGYKVHEDKLRRLKVPIYLSHTVVNASGKDSLDSIIIAEVDKNFKIIEGTQKSFEVDTLLVAVGLNPVNEFYNRARQFGFEVWASGDAEEIAEASSAIFSGKIAGMKILNSFKKEKAVIPSEWIQKADILKSRPGIIKENIKQTSDMEVFPCIHCLQEIPCNPCVTCCPRGSIKIKGSIMGIPEFEGTCSACGICVAICPGLAVTLLDFRPDRGNPVVTMQFELGDFNLKTGQTYPVVDIAGNVIGNGILLNVREIKKIRKTSLVSFKVQADIARDVVSFIPFNYESFENKREVINRCAQKEHACIVCRCERVEKKTIQDAIQEGIRDFNQLKAQTRATMGSCGGKTCIALIERIFIEEGIPLSEITPNTIRPLFIEVPVRKLAGIAEEEGL